MNGRRRGGVAEAVRDGQPPVPIVVGVGLRVAGRQIDGSVDVERLVGEPQIELEVGPVVGEPIDDRLECLREAHSFARSRASSPPLPPRLSSNLWPRPTHPISNAEYRALTEGCGLVDRSERGKLALTGPGAKEFLAGQMTNDIEALAPEAAVTRRSSRRRARCSATSESSTAARSCARYRALGAAGPVRHDPPLQDRLRRGAAQAHRRAGIAFPRRARRAPASRARSRRGPHRGR